MKSLMNNQRKEKIEWIKKYHSLVENYCKEAEENYNSELQAKQIIKDLLELLNNSLYSSLVIMKAEKFLNS